MSVADRIEEKLRQGLSPTRLQVSNDSAAHAGHAGSPGTGESHFRVLVVSERFRGLSRLARQRLVYQLLAEEMAGPVHALALVTRTPEEDSQG
ncbi:MAG TPA: BolA family protein [Candidatus Nitrosotenuis sp.]|nr:BolA family protein [Candidatus Nitrosotenuis sp.]